jgi:hypothetical protein
MPTVFVDALVQLVDTYRERDTIGVLLTGLPDDIPVRDFLLEAGGPQNVWATLVSPPDADALQDWARDEGWSEDHFRAFSNPTEGATHAVGLRNEDPGEAIRLVVAWEEQNRLHSLVNRGYDVAGPDELMEEIAKLGEKKANNTPRKNFWEALRSDEIKPLLSLGGVADYFDYIFAQEPSSRRKAYRDALPKLGFMRDHKLLTRSFTDADSIERRLNLNFALIERMQEDRSRDRERAYSNVDADSDLEDAYKAFTQLARGAQSAIDDITYEEAHALIKTRPAAQDSGSGSEDETDSSEDEPGPVEYDSPSDAAIDIGCAGQEEEVESAIDSFIDFLDEETRTENTQIETDDYVFDFDPDARALALTHHLVSDEVFGGRLAADDTVETVIGQTGRYVEEFDQFNDVFIEGLKTRLERAEKAAPEFEGLRYLETYLQRRRVLTDRLSAERDVRHVDVLSSRSSALLYLLAKPEVERAVRASVEAFMELYDHLSDKFAYLAKKATPEGATRLYRRLLSLDVMFIKGDQEQAALLAPIHPLVLWKHGELIKTIRDRRDEMSQEDVELLRSEMRSIPEPLLAFYAPDQEEDGSAAELVFSERVGELPVYRTSVTEAADVSHGSIQNACEKLSTLYPPAKTMVRLVSVNPQDLDPAAKAVKKLLDNGFQRVNLRVAFTDRFSGRTVRAPSNLDEYHAAGRFTMSNLPAETLREVEEELEDRPAHLLILSGEQERRSGMVEREKSRLHPLSVPGRIESDPIERELSLQPRSKRPYEPGGNPFGLYNDVVSQVSGQKRDLSMRQRRRTQMERYEPLLRHCEFCAAAGFPQFKSAAPLILTEGGGVQGDTVISEKDDRILSGIKKQITKLNYTPGRDDVRRLLREIQKLGGDGIFSAISANGDQGFSKSAVRGQVGLAVALRWYRENVAEESSVILSLDSHLARQWLRSRDSQQRNDLLVFRRGRSGPQVDLVEVKSYSATHDDAGDSYPVKQLRSVARTLFPILQSDGQGDLLTDRRRELLRRHVYQESLSHEPESWSPEWIDTLNEVIDGRRNLVPNLSLVEVRMGSNDPEEDTRQLAADPDSEDPILSQKVRRIRLSEKSISKFLGGRRSSDTTSASRPSHGQEDGLELEDDGEEVTATTSEGRDEEETASVTSENGSVEQAGSSVDESDVSTSPAFPRTEERNHASGNGTPDEPRSTEAETESVEESTGKAPEASVNRPLGFGTSPDEKKWVEKKSKEVYRALDDIGVRPASAVDPDLVDAGPTVYRFKVRLRPGEKVSSIQSRTEDLMRELKLSSEPIVDNLPGTNLIYIDLPREERQFARLTPVLEYYDLTEIEPYSIPAGVSPAGGIEWLHLPSLPHMLVAGSTGSGKSVFLYTLIASLTHYHDPDEIELVLVDPKKTDFILFGNLPHLRNGEIIKEPEDAVGQLTALINQEVQRRTEILEEAIRKNIYSYNEHNPANPIPPIFVIIDEFADLSDVLDGGEEEEEFNTALRRLAQRARSVGIHLIIATQRPTTDIVDGTIKANLPCRVSFRLGSNTDSRTILDQGGAENLLGDGDMLLRREGKLKRLQGLFVSDENLRSMVVQ